jgi:hypothetical protein
MGPYEMLKERAARLRKARPKAPRPPSWFFAELRKCGLNAAYADLKLRHAHRRAA